MNILDVLKNAQTVSTEEQKKYDKEYEEFVKQLEQEKEK